MKQEGKKDGVRVKAEKEEECDKLSEDRYSTEYVLSQTQETSAIAQNTVAGLVYFLMLESLNQISREMYIKMD